MKGVSEKMLIQTNDENEMNIIAAYRKLNSVGKDAVLDFLTFLLKLEKYTDPTEDKPNDGSREQ